MIYTIENDKFSVSVDTTGAQLQSMYSKETKKGALSEAIIVMTKKIEESEAITVFLGIDNTSEAH